MLKDSRGGFRRYDMGGIINDPNLSKWCGDQKPDDNKASQIRNV